ncbi:alpha/beta hydrolase [Streptomyces jumonjinensis]|uniref:alpha/beta hydrolase n=1 Tax=Streptomyces jumonjinensis TaxID=1945 RepID=UPI0037B94A24
MAPLLAMSVMATLAPALAAAPAAAAGPLDGYTQQKPEWQRCAPDQPASFQCATIEVPLDYRRPGGTSVDIAISRIEATDDDKRRGVLLFNPGGPGVPGLDMPLSMTQTLPRSVRNRYDLIGFDPRGVAKSTPVTCDSTPEEQQLPRPYKKESFAGDVEWARTVADKCRAKYGDSLQHFTTRNTARDMDVIRAVLGEKKINYLGYSYGTYLGAVYTQLFPRRSGRMVLDSAVDPGIVWRGMIQSWAHGAEPAFKRWAKWAAARHETYGLGDTPAEVGKAFYDIVAQADREPVTVGATPLNGDQLRERMRPRFFSLKGASDWVVHLKNAAAGKPTPELEWFQGTDAELSAFLAIACGDANWPKNPETYRKDAIRDKARYPLYGDAASNIMPCAFWDRNAERATEVDNPVGALIVQAEWDSQTPLTGGVAMHRAMKGSRMITVDEAETHALYGRGISDCADRLITSYLTAGGLPAGNVTCAVNPAPTTPERAESPGLPTPKAFFSAPGR